MMCVAAVDPGRDKCGLAVVKEDDATLFRRVIRTAELEAELSAAQKTYDFSALVLGNGTTSKRAESRIRKALCVPVHVVDEYRTTELAKRAYWRIHPRTGWRRFLPATMLVPPEPVDDLVAVILARRYLAAKKESQEMRSTEE